ncbi:MAG TPA: hypothetical protein VN132_02215, partial [Bdellovibrio sp.]|nr:hypothetical protein [Bdellovibrio sp.]
ETIYLGYSNGMASFQDKSLQFVMLFIVILFFQFVAQMIWGHFAAQIDVTKSDSSKTLPPAWFRSEYSSAAWKNIVKE